MGALLIIDMKIGILYLCTGHYRIFLNQFLRSARPHLYPGHILTYHIWTDNPVEGDDIVWHQQDCEGWPLESLHRHKRFLEHEEELKQYDYLFFFNANTHFYGAVNDRCLPDSTQKLLAFRHPWFELIPRSRHPQIHGTDQAAQIADDEATYYFQSCWQGGIATDFLESCKQMEQLRFADRARGIIPIWQDESYWNKILVRRDVLNTSIRTSANAVNCSGCVDFINKDLYGGYAKLRKLGGDTGEGIV